MDKERSTNSKEKKKGGVVYIISAMGGQASNVPTKPLFCHRYEFSFLVDSRFISKKDIK